MKRFLLCIMVSAFATSISAQKLMPANNNLRHSADVENENNYKPNLISEKVFPAELVDIGVAPNIFTILNVDQNQVYYSPELNAMSMVHRQDVAVFTEGGSGTVRYDLSQDQGASWDINLGPMTPQLVSTGAQVPISTAAGDDFVRGCRYPNGIIYNPPGNTDITNASYVSTGPCLFETFGDATGWGISYYSSQKLDGSDAEDQYNIFLPDSAFGSIDFFPTSLVQGGDAVYAIGDNASETILIWKGVPNGDATAFEWSVTEINPEFKLDVNGTTIYSGYMNLAFTLDGSKGYAVISAGLSGQTDNLYIPNVYETNDNGQTWTLVSDDYEMGLSDVGALMLNRPYLRNFDMVIDADDRLHVFGEVMQMDPTLTSFSYEGYLVDFMWDGSDWTDIVIGTIDDTQEGVFQGNFQDLFCHPQASITADGTVAIFSWSTSLGSDVNDEPDLLARGVNTTNLTMTDVINMTEDSDAEEQIYFATTSPWLITNGDDFMYELPAVCFIDWSGSNLDPVQLYYLKEIGFDPDDFSVGIEEESPLIGLIIYPNPADDEVLISFSLKSEIDTEITLFDAMGRVVTMSSTQSNGFGLHNYYLDTSSLTNGHYIIQIKTDENLTSRRLNITR